MLRHLCILGDSQTKGDKIRIGCPTLAFSGAQKRAEMLRHPYIPGNAQTKGDKISGRFTPVFSGTQKGGKCYVTPAFSGILKQRGTKSVAASSMPSRGPKRG